MSTRTYKDRVARGAALLDQFAPGWHRKIDLDRLRLSSCQDCVCGQLAFNTASKVIERELDTARWDAWTIFRQFLSRRLKRKNETQLADELIDNPSHFGFVSVRESYATLDAEWRRIIEERLEKEASAA